MGKFEGTKRFLSHEHQKHLTDVGWVVLYLGRASSKAGCRPCAAGLRSKVQPSVQLGPPVPFHSGFGEVGTSGTRLKPSVRLSARSQFKPAPKACEELSH